MVSQEKVMQIILTIVFLCCSYFSMAQAKNCVPKDKNCEAEFPANVPPCKQCEMKAIEAFVGKLKDAVCNPNNKSFTSVSPRFRDYFIGRFFSYSDTQKNKFITDTLFTKFGNDVKAVMLYVADAPSVPEVTNQPYPSYSEGNKHPK